MNPILNNDQVGIEVGEITLIPKHKSGGRRKEANPISGNGQMVAEIVG